MTTGPTDVKVTTAAGGPDGMPLALKFNEGLGPMPRWWTCATHGDALPQNAWGCPECVRELRRKCAILGAALREVYELAAWQADDDADPGNTSPDDNVAHTNGLIRQACQRGFHGA